jgi:hypothetical protein
MVDSNGDWYSPLLSYPPDQAGKTLLDRLSPAFRFPDSRIPVPQTFRSMLTEDARVVIKGHKAVVEQGLSIITLELVAVTDWNNDGKGDWLVLCRTAFSDTPRKFREYYLTITDLESPVLIPQVQMVIDHVYGKVSVVSNASVGELAENVSDEFMQGQTTVTQAPDSTAVQKKKEEGSSLKKTSLSR